MSFQPADDRFKADVLKDLPEAVFRPVEDRYREEPRDRWEGQVGLVAAPRSVEEVSSLVRAAAKHRVAVVPYGGGTGLVGAQVMPEGAPLLISMERMSAVRAVYPEENVLVVEAGAILEEVQSAAMAVNRLFPLSLAAQGSCRIGGNLATNAGGVGVLRYGNTRDLCLGLEAVLPDGTIWNGLSRLRKDNTGYDLRNLLIGSEGTLGVITAASLKLFPRPASTGVAFLIVDGPEAALKLLTLARDLLGEGVSAFELLDGQGFEFMAETVPDVRLPFEDFPKWSVLIEVGLPRGRDAVEGIEALFAEGLEAGLVSDGLIAQSEAQAAAFWSVREHMPVANRRIGSVSSHDISLPLGEMMEFIERAEGLIKAMGPFRINCFGHVGDGNLHFNVFPPPGANRADYMTERDEVKRQLHDLAHELGGSVSAEHGIGRLKVGALETYGAPAKLAAMRAIKGALDPLGIMNPGAVLR